MSQKKSDACYAIEDDGKALACLKDLVRTAEGGCPPRLVLLTQPNCVPCSEEKAAHKKAISQGVVQELSIDSPEGLAVVKQNEIDFFPALLLVDCNNKIIYPTGV